VVPLGGTTRVDIDTSAQPVSVLTTAEVDEVPGARVRLTVDVDDVRECPPRTGASAVAATARGTGPRAAPGTRRPDLPQGLLADVRDPEAPRFPPRPPARWPA
jgi:hypothetical protein